MSNGGKSSSSGGRSSSSGGRQRASAAAAAAAAAAADADALEDVGVRPGWGSVLSLYGGEEEPQSHAIRLVIAEKGVKVNFHHVTRDRIPEDLLASNPYAAELQPTLVDRELVLYETQIIMEYLDGRFPHPPLMPMDPVARAHNQLYRYRIQRDIYGLVDALTGKSTAEANRARKKLRDHLNALAPIFDGKPYFLSDEYSIVDCFLAPILWRLPHYGIKGQIRHRGLSAYMTRLFNTDSFRASLTELEEEMR